MSDLDEKIEQLKGRADAARVRKAKAEAGLENAQIEQARILEELKAQFGLDNLVDARAKLAELQKSLADRVADIEEILSKF